MLHPYVTVDQEMDQQMTFASLVLNGADRQSMHSHDRLTMEIEGNSASHLKLALFEWRSRSGISPGTNQVDDSK
jgi:hypothetical protein